MRWDDVYLAGVGSYLPQDRQTAEEAVAAGLYTAESAEAHGIRAVRVASDEEPGPVMAAAAGREAIAMSGVDPADVDLVLHGDVAHQGRDFWSPASYVQLETGCHQAAAAIEIRQGSNGAFAALELGAAHLASRPDARAALVTAGDAFREPYINRWTSDDQTVFGDGGCAAVLSTQGGLARVVATASASESTIEPLYRGEEPWTAAPVADRPVDLTSRKEQWLSRNEDAYDDTLALIARRFDGVLKTVLDDAEMTSRMPTGWSTPR